MGLAAAVGRAASADAYTVGYYEMCSGAGTASQAPPIVTAGGTPVQLTDLTAVDLAGIDVLFVTNCNNGAYAGEYLANLSAIDAAVAGGMSLVLHDRYVDVAETILPGGAGFNIIRDFTDDTNIDVLDATTLVTNGPGGVITNATLDGGNSSSHGFAVLGSLPGGGRFILSRTDPTEVVTFSYPYGAGSVVYSSIPLDFYLAGSGSLGVNAGMQAYAANVVAYAASLTHCGNGVIDGGEACDEGAGNGTSGSCCTAACTFRPAGETCRAAADVCDAVEVCTGAAGSCPGDAAEPAGTACRTAADVCDVTEYCDGASTTCPADSVAGAFVTCRPSAGACDPAEHCDGTDVACPADAVEPAGTTCRAAAGTCDLAETCDGASAECPADGKSSAVCRPAAGGCDVAESCDGITNDCPADAFVPAGTTCRGAAGICDVGETCTGNAAACPADAFEPATTVCRPAAGTCDLAEHCSGAGAACPADVKSTAVCRPANGQCDVAESCDGASNACPVDALQPDGTSCDDGDVCAIPDSCQGGLCVSGGGPDDDGDGVCNASDNCVHDANADQADYDQDGAGNRCDANDAPLNPTRVKLKVSTGAGSDSSNIGAKGDFVTLLAGDVFTASQGITVAVADGSATPVTRAYAFTAAQCKASATTIRCQSADRLAKVIFKTSTVAHGVWRFTAKFKKQALVGPLIGPARVTVTYGPFVDRVGTVADCATSFTGLLCRQLR